MLHRILWGLFASATVTLLPAAVTPEPPSTFTTPNSYLKYGTPTFVVGTTGDARTNRAVAAQVDAIRDLLFARAGVLKDDSIDVTKGAAAWPSNPVLYGGPHVNTVLARLAPSLPFALQPGKLVLGREVFEGDEYRLITVVPARAPDATGPGYPEFLLYAGTGTPGVAEINAVSHGGEPILVVDAFGRLVSGQWHRLADGRVEPVLSQRRSRRIAWRTREEALPSFSGPPGRVQIRFPAQLGMAADDDLVVQACLRGLAQSIQKLEITQPASVTIYAYPEHGTKRALTGNEGDGHADILSHSLHVVHFEPSVDGPLERIVSHEATHVLTDEAWGAAGTALLGEGTAVWASGSYGGEPLAVRVADLTGEMPPLHDLLRAKFRQLPEVASYPLAGLFVDVAVKRVGLAKVRDHLYGATASTWDAACRAAGTTNDELEKAMRQRLTAAHGGF